MTVKAPSPAGLSAGVDAQSRTIFRNTIAQEAATRSGATVIQSKGSTVKDLVDTLPVKAGMTIRKTSTADHAEWYLAVQAQSRRADISDIMVDGPS